jgi:hypothetical protein
MTLHRRMIFGKNAFDNWALLTVKGTSAKCENPWENHCFLSGEDRNQTFECFRCVFEEFEKYSWS